MGKELTQLLAALLLLLLDLQGQGLSFPWLPIILLKSGRWTSPQRMEIKNGQRLDVCYIMWCKHGDNVKPIFQFPFCVLFLSTRTVCMICNLEKPLYFTNLLFCKWNTWNYMNVRECFVINSTKAYRMYAILCKRGSLLMASTIIASMVNMCSL